jgi:hypothetical protein
MESESQYLNRRAQEEQEAAERAADPKTRELHIELAGRYRDAAQGHRPPPVPDGPIRAGLPDDFRILE